MRIISVYTPFPVLQAKYRTRAGCLIGCGGKVMLHTESKAWAIPPIQPLSAPQVMQHSEIAGHLIRHARTRHVSTGSASKVTPRVSFWATVPKVICACGLSETACWCGWEGDATFSAHESVVHQGETWFLSTCVYCGESCSRQRYIEGLPIRSSTHDRPTS